LSRASALFHFLLSFSYKLAAPRKALFLAAAFVARTLTPRSRKAGYGLFLRDVRVDQDWMEDDRMKKTLFF
jgi:hypothetical protein